ncbi:predicted protein [Sclerotinia sclerotiorum 1980 UF-70]|uniref:Uncharacterized protein n=1 Tax=Sclerotinia sclerotiorum (strain ATCC 18683 / 1980 / Ss-1) TaxID=665079 RepID=A7EXL2_SCLS1|nr:predicted protein [Sclerotinia sclerotiorum 1980 UF-70]EDN94204.1 predicted protein [Sclerotinia sclerotiorum 1980 UF-70]
MFGPGVVRCLEDRDLPEIYKASNISHQNGKTPPRAKVVLHVTIMPKIDWESVKAMLQFRFQRAIPHIVQILFAPLFLDGV